MDQTFFVEAEVCQNGDLDLDWSWVKTVLAARWAGKKVILRIQTWTQRRSIAANNFYWSAIVTPIAEYTGHTKDEVHALLKAKFANETMYVVNEKTGEVDETQVPVQTRSMPKDVFSRYVDMCKGYAVWLGIQLQPWEGDQSAFYEDTP
jgi:hypothetical protein